MIRTTLQKSITLGVFALMFLLTLSTSKASAASFNMVPANQTHEIGCTREARIEIDTAGQPSNGAEIIINYDTSQIQIIDSNSSVSGVQIKEGDAFQTYFYNQVDTVAGEIRLTGASFFDSITTVKTFGIIEFAGLPGATNAGFTIEFNGVGNTFDSNISHAVTNLDLLTSTTNSSYNFIVGPCQADTQSPNILFLGPTNGQSNFPVDGNIAVRITDNQSGVDLDSIEFVVNGVTYTTSSPFVTYFGSSLDYTFTINPPTNLPSNEASSLVVRVEDLSGNFRTRQNTFNIPPVPVPVPPPVDNEPPIIVFVDPTPFDIEVDSDAQIVINIADEMSDIDINSVVIFINGDPYLLTDPEVEFVQNSLRDLVISITPREPISDITYTVVEVEASDASGNDTYRMLVFNMTNLSQSELTREQCQSIFQNVDISVNDSTICPTSELDDLIESSGFANVSDVLGLSGTFAAGAGLAWFMLMTLYALTMPSLIPKLIALIFKIPIKNPMGVVYDSLTGKPVVGAILTVFEPGSAKPVIRTMSDQEGRYNAKIKAGRYLFEVKKIGFKTKTIEMNYSEDIDVDKLDLAIRPTYSVVDITADDTWEKFSLNVYKVFTALQYILFYGGFILVLYANINNPHLFNRGLFMVYMGVFVVQINKFKSAKKTSMVLDSVLKIGSPFSIVKIFDKATSKLTDIFTTDKKGLFNMDRLKQGEYNIYVKSLTHKYNSALNNLEPALVNSKEGSLLNVHQSKGSLKLYVEPLAEGLGSK